ncbi:MAG: DMT family transporter [Bacteroidales bacterium]|jgi:drug/metabolite transporter (DMT)-like permease|nr:DMT family transporter [Bacteroidales bacterium]
MKGKRKIWHWLVLAALSLIWGTSYILMKKGLESFSTYQIGSLRIIITFLSLLPVAIRNLPKLNKTYILSIAIIGFFGSGIPAFLFPLAQTRIDSSLAGMLNSLSPVFTLIIGIMFYRQHVIRSQIAGVFLGLIGAFGLLYNGSFTLNYYGLFVVLATLLYGISTNEVSKIKGMNGLQIASLAFFVLSPFAVIIFLFTDIQAAAETANWVRNFGFIAILSVFGSAIALALFYVLVRDTSPVFASMVTYFAPVVSTLWGIADNEHLMPYMLVSVLLILGGVYLIYRPGFLTNLRNIIK